MFNDEESLGFKKMCEFSIVDGFLEITEDLAKMIKFVANEPSVGLFYIQQHTQNAVPNLINLKNNVVEKSNEMSLHAEDLEDSITVMRSMKECGFPILDEMFSDIKNSLAIISTKQPKRGLITSPSWRPTIWGRGTSYRQQDGESSFVTAGYFSHVFRSAKERATSCKWSQMEYHEPYESKGEVLPPDPKPTLSVGAPSHSSEVEISEIADDPREDMQVSRSLSSHELLSSSENYDEFKASKEAKLEEWLGGTTDK